MWTESKREHSRRKRSDAVFKCEINRTSRSKKSSRSRRHNENVNFMGVCKIERGTGQDIVRISVAGLSRTFCARRGSRVPPNKNRRQRRASQLHPHERICEVYERTANEDAYAVRARRPQKFNLISRCAFDPPRLNICKARGRQAGTFPSRLPFAPRRVYPRVCDKTRRKFSRGEAYALIGPDFSLFRFVRPRNGYVMN